MSYDISWHSNKETVPNLETGKCLESYYYTNNNEKAIEAKELHSGLCGELECYKKPFSHESTGLNITSNLYNMFSWVINNDSSIDWKKSIHGKTGREIEPILRKAVKKMEDESNEAMKYNSPNGWGTYPDALRFLKDLLAESLVYQDAFLSINY
jgi:hypothetical protein